MTHTGWTPNHTKLRNTLAQLYLDRASAQRVATDAGMNPVFMTFSDNATNNWHEIVKKADDQGLLVRLIEQASSEFPTNEVLKEALGIFKTNTRSSEIPGVVPVNAMSISEPKLRDFIRDQFATAELADLLVDLTDALRQAGKTSTDIDIDTFSNSNQPRSTIAREMVQYFRRRTWTPYLIEAVKNAREDAFREAFGE